MSVEVPQLKVVVRDNDSLKGDDDDDDDQDLLTLHEYDDGDDDEDFDEKQKDFAGEDQTLLGGKRSKSRMRCVCNWACFKRQFTWERVKILVILATMALALWMFASEKESSGLGCTHLLSVSAGFPSAQHVSTSESLDVIEVDLTVQKLSSKHSLDTVLVVSMQACQRHGHHNGTGNSTVCDLDDVGGGGSGGEWVTLSSWEVTPDSEFEENNVISHQFKQSSHEQDKYDSWRMLYNTTSAEPLAMNAEMLQMDSIVEYEVIFAALVLVGVYVLIVFELVHRTIAALLGSFVALALVSKIRQRPTLEELIEWIDMETIGLLFGMMVMVGIFSMTGFFEWSAIKAYKMAKGNMWRLTVLLCLFTAVVSAFLDNVTTMLLLTPVTIRLCKVLDVDPTPILLAEVLYSNIGGTATPIGDPPNVIIVNDKRIASFDEVNFGQFTVHVAPGILITACVCYFLMRWQTKGLLKRSPHRGKLKEIEIWRQTAAKMQASITIETDEDKHVRTMLERHIARLEREIEQAGDDGDDDQVAPIDITALEKKYAIRNRSLFISSCAVLGGVIIMFFIYSALPIDINLAWIALIGAMIHLTVSGIRDIEPIIEKVEFSTLLFFAGLFILMQALEELGLIGWIADQISALIEQVEPGRPRLAAAITVIIWVAAIVSAFLDNLPFATAMLPVIYQLATGSLDLPIGPLTWALAYGTCLGGNGTLIGASANVVTIGIAEQEGIHISFVRFLQAGFPMMLLSVLCVNCYLLITHVAIPWGYDAYT
jgi:P protein